MLSFCCMIGLCQELFGPGAISSEQRFFAGKRKASLEKIETKQRERSSRTETQFPIAEALL